MQASRAHNAAGSAALAGRVGHLKTTAEVVAELKLDRPGTYRLRIATVDRAGRTAVVWKRIAVTK